MNKEDLIKLLLGMVFAISQIVVGFLWSQISDLQDKLEQVELKQVAIETKQELGKPPRE